MLGGTNYVAIAGVGADAARFNPKDPSYQKLVGISGYDWGSAVEEVQPAVRRGLRPAVGALGEQFGTARAEPALQVGDERQRLWSQDLVEPVLNDLLHEYGLIGNN